MKEEQLERKAKQLELASMFYEMGMPLDVVEKISGISSGELIKNLGKDKINTQTIDKQEHGNYNNVRY